MALKSYSLFLCSLIVLLSSLSLFCDGGHTSTFVRKTWSVDMPLDADVFVAPSGYNAPKQVHIMQGDQLGKAMIVSWVTTDEPGLSVVHYWSENTPHKLVAKGRYITYRFFNYASGYIFLGLRWLNFRPTPSRLSNMSMA